MNTRIATTLFSLVCIAAGTLLAIQFAKGYRPTPQGTIRPTGLLAANSFPNGASVYLNGNLTTATDTTLNLEPGDYDVEIKKDGYTPWKKKIRIEKELVVQTNAVLYPVAASLTPLTFTGADQITPSPDGETLLFTTASASATKSNGIYTLSLSDSPVALQRGPYQIARASNPALYTKATFLWSPDASQVMLSTPTRTHLLPVNRITDLDTAPDVTVRRSQTLADWAEIFDKRRTAALSLFPEEIVAIATQSAQHVYVSPDQERVVYTATASARLSDTLLPPLPAASTQAQEREIVPGHTYVYDRHEDRNFLISTGAVTLPTPPPATVRPRARTLSPTPAPLSADQLFAAELYQLQSQTSALFTRSAQWMPDSKHLLLVTENGIDIIEYDGTNRVQVYAGPFSDRIVFPWPNGSKLMILTNFNERGSGILNLYAVGIK